MDTGSTVLNNTIFFRIAQYFEHVLTTEGPRTNWLSGITNEESIIMNY